MSRPAFIEFVKSLVRSLGTSHAIPVDWAQQAFDLLGDKLCFEIYRRQLPGFVARMNKWELRGACELVGGLEASRLLDSSARATRPSCNDSARPIIDEPGSET